MWLSASNDVASVFQTHYLIIAKTYQRDDVRERDRQRDHFQNCYIFVTPVVANEMKWIGEDGEMIEMTLSSRHRIRNSSPGGLRPSTLPIGHGGSPQYWVLHVDGGGGNIFVSFKPPRPGTEPRTLAWKAAVLTTTLGPPPAGCRASHVALVVALVCGQSCNFRVSRRVTRHVPNRADVRVGVFCT